MGIEVEPKAEGDGRFPTLRSRPVLKARSPLEETYFQRNLSCEKSWFSDGIKKKSDLGADRMNAPSPVRTTALTAVSLLTKSQRLINSLPITSLGCMNVRVVFA